MNLYEYISRSGIYPDNIKKDTVLNRENVEDFCSALTLDICDGHHSYRGDYTIYKDVIIRIKDHPANYANFVRDIEEWVSDDRELKGIVNVCVGDYDDLDRTMYNKRNVMDFDTFSYEYGDAVKIADVYISDGTEYDKALKDVQRQIKRADIHI